MEEKKRDERKNNERKKRGRAFERPAPDPVVADAIRRVEEHLMDSLEPAIVQDLNGFQRKEIQHYFARGNEHHIKTVRESEESVVLKIYPVGKLRRFAEIKAQEVMMTGESQKLPPMGSFHRFIVHEYINNRGGLRTESAGEGSDRHVEIFPVFGRTPRKAKCKLTR